MRTSPSRIAKLAGLTALVSALLVGGSASAVQAPGAYAPYDLEYWEETFGVPCTVVVQPFQNVVRKARYDAVVIFRRGDATHQNKEIAVRLDARPTKKTAVVCDAGFDRPFRPAR